MLILFASVSSCQQPDLECMFKKLTNIYKNKHNSIRSEERIRNRNHGRKVCVSCYVYLSYNHELFLRTHHFSYTMFTKSPSILFSLSAF